MNDADISVKDLIEDDLNRDRRTFLRFDLDTVNKQADIEDPGLIDVFTVNYIGQFLAISVSLLPTGNLGNGKLCIGRDAGLRAISNNYGIGIPSKGLHDRILIRDHRRIHQRRIIRKRRGHAIFKRI